jgi:WD40 repeat protein
MVSTVKYSPDERLIAVGTENSLSLVLDALSGETLHVIEQHLMEVFFSPNGRYLAATQYNNNTVLIWDVEVLLNTSEAQPAFAVQVPGAAWNIAWTANSERLYIATFGFMDPTSYSFSLITGELNQVTDGGHVIAVSEDVVATQRLLSLGNDALVLLNTSTGQIVQALDEVSGLTDVDYSRSTQYLAIAQGAGGLFLYDTQQQEMVAFVGGTGAMITDVMFLRDHYLLSAETLSYEVSTLSDGGGCVDTILRVWDVVTGEDIGFWQLSTLGFDYPACTRLLARLEDGRVLLRVNDELHIFDLFSSEFYALSLPIPTPYTIRQVVVSADQTLMGILVFQQPEPDVILVWSIAEGFTTLGEPSLIFSLVNGEPEDFIFAPETHNLITYTSERRLLIWDIATGEYVDEIGWSRPRQLNNADLVLSPDGSVLALRAVHIHLFDTDVYAEDYTERAIISDEAISSYESIFYGARSDWFATLSFDEHLQLWTTDLETTLPARISSVTFSEDGTLMITGNR